MDKHNTSGTIHPADTQAQKDFDEKMAFIDSIDLDDEPAEDEEQLSAFLRHVLGVEPEEIMALGRELSGPLSDFD